VHADALQKWRGRFFLGSVVPFESELGYNPVFRSLPAAPRRRQGRTMSSAPAVVVMEIGPVLEAP